MHKEEHNFWVLFAAWLTCAVVTAMIFYCFPVNVEARTMRATAYCGCRKCNGKWTGQPTALGTNYEAGRTIAVDKHQISLGTHVWINGHEYIAEDTGSGIGWDCVDIYFDSHSEALRWGVRYVDVDW